MAWDNKPTDAQLDRLYYWLSWRIPTPTARDAIKWLGEHATRKEASDEMTRIRELFKTRKLDQETCFASPIWDDYEKGNKN